MPRQCLTWHKFVHGKLTYRVETLVCIIYALDHEESCERTAKRINCGEEHPASRVCFHHNLEQETLQIQTKERLSYSEAKLIAKEKCLK